MTDLLTFRRLHFCAPFLPRQNGVPLDGSVFLKDCFLAGLDAVGLAKALEQLLSLRRRCSTPVYARVQGAVYSCLSSGSACVLRRRARKTAVDALLDLCVEGGLPPAVLVDEL